MARKVGIDLDDVRTTAVAIAEHDGIDAVTMAAVARALGIRTPSLYAHVDGVAGLRGLVAAQGAHRLARALAEAADGCTGGDALRAFAQAYREFAHDSAGLYDAAQADAPSPADDPELAAALTAPVDLVAAALEALGVPREQHVHHVRSIRAALHGFVDLERKAGFGLPDDVDASYATLVELLLAGLERH